MARDTGLPSADAQYDFSRARRRRALARLSARLRRVDDVDHILPFEEVARALGRVGERRLGLELIALDSIIGTVDRSREFDRDFRPTSPARPRALAAHQPRPAQGRGDAAHRRLPDRRAALREGRAPPGVGGARARSPRHQRLRDRGPHPGRRGPRDPDAGPAAEEPPAPLLRARAAAERGARAHPPERRVALRRARRGRGGVGFPREPGARTRSYRARRSPRRGSATSTSPWSRCCARRSSCRRA